MSNKTEFLEQTVKAFGEAHRRKRAFGLVKILKAVDERLDQLTV
jgi:hypothetical protein